MTRNSDANAVTAPQTFEEWWDNDPVIVHQTHYEHCQLAFAAGVASQQAEIERLNEAMHSLSYTHLNTKLRRYEAVVEAARAMARYRAVPDGIRQQEWDAFRAALAALDEPITRKHSAVVPDGPWFDDHK